MSFYTRIGFLSVLCVSAVQGFAAELPASPEEFVRRFALSLAEPDSAPLQSLFLEEPALQAQARTLHNLLKGLTLADRRLYEAPDQDPQHALIKIRLDQGKEGGAWVLGLRIQKSEGGWRVVLKPTMKSLARPGKGRVAGLRSEMGALQEMMEGVGEFVAEMAAIYSPTHHSR